MEEEKAYQLGLRYLSRYSTTAWRLFDYLTRKGVEKEVASKVIKTFKAEGLLNDFEYALAFIQQRKGKYGSFRLFNELLKKGVSEKEIKEALKTLDYQEEEETLKNLAQSYLRKNIGSEEAKLKRRLYSFLLRRGFSPDLILKFFKEHNFY